MNVITAIQCRKIPLNLVQTTSLVSYSCHLLNNLTYCELLQLLLKVRVVYILHVFLFHKLEKVF